MERGGAEQVLEYDWDRHEVRQVSPPPESDALAERLDLKALEAATHETWMAVIPWSDGLRVIEKRDTRGVPSPCPPIDLASPMGPPASSVPLEVRAGAPPHNLKAQ